MATINITQRFQKVTIPANTSEHELNFENAIGGGVGSLGTALIERVSGTSFQVSNKTIDSNSGAVTEDNPKMFIDIARNVPVKIKGGAGSEVFNIMIIR